MHREFAFYIILAFALVGLAFFAPTMSSPPTAQATGGAYEVTVNIPEPATQQPGQPSPAQAVQESAACAPGCGEPCWLDSSGSPPGTYETSGGSLGLLDCSGLCWHVDAHENTCE